MLYLNDHFTDSPLIDPRSDAYMYGYGVFETLRTYNGAIFRLDEHIDRLFESASIIQLKMRHSRDEVATIIDETFNKCGLSEARIKVVVTDTEFIVWPQELILRPEEWYKTGIPIVSYPAERNFPDAKHMNCLPSVMGQKYAKFKGVYEALLFDRDGQVREGCYSNVFWIMKGVLYTVKERVLPGITRQIVIECAKDVMPFDYSDISLEDLLDADECFITNTTSEVLPVVEIDGEGVGDSKVGEWTKRLISKFSTTEVLK